MPNGSAVPVTYTGMVLIVEPGAGLSSTVGTGGVESTVKTTVTEVIGVPSKVFVTVAVCAPSATPATSRYKLPKSSQRAVPLLPSSRTALMSEPAVQSPAKATTGPFAMPPSSGVRSQKLSGSTSTEYVMQSLAVVPS